MDNIEKITHIILKISAVVLVFFFYFDYKSTIKPDTTYIHKFDSISTRIKLLEQKDSILESGIKESNARVSKIDSATIMNHKNVSYELKKLKATPNRRVVLDADSIYRANR